MTGVAFSALLQGMRQTGEGFAAHVPDNWLQGRTTYGGLSASLCLAAAERALPDLPPLRSAQFGFIGPASGDIVLRVAELRRGRTAVFVGVDSFWGEALATRALLCFGAARPGLLSWQDLPMPAVARPGASPALPRAGALPRFMANFDVAFAGGGMPAGGAERPEIALWLRHRDPAGPADMAALLALADAPPPAGLTALLAPVPLSTATWMVDIVGSPRGGWHLVRSAAETFEDGYSTQTLTVWGEDGAPLVASRQLIAFYPPR